MAKIDSAPANPAGFGRLDQAALLVSMAALALLGLLVVFSILGRALFRMPIPDDVLLAELLMVPIVALPLAPAQWRDDHITITLFTDALPPHWIRRLRAFGNLIGLVFFLLLSWAVGATLAEDFSGGHYHSGLLRVPVWPMKLVFFLALTGFSLRLLADLAGSLRTRQSERTDS